MGRTAVPALPIDNGVPDVSGREQAGLFVLRLQAVGVQASACLLRETA